MMGMGFSTVVITQSAFAEDITTTCTQWQIDQGICEPGARQMTLRIVNFFLFFLGLVATVFLIYGGFLYITSAGNDESVNKAKKIIIYAAVGLILILVAAVLAHTLINMLGPDTADPTS